MPRTKCPCCGAYKMGDGTYVDEKGYLKISAGVLRGKRVHTLIAEAKLGRKLEKDETVHHLDGDKSNCHPDNLQVLSRRDHGAVSAKQRWYFKEHDIKQEEDWNAYFEAERRDYVEGDTDVCDSPK